MFKSTSSVGVDKVGISDRNNLSNRFTGPCALEEEMSYVCIKKHGNENKAQECVDEFANYKNCKRFWKSIVRDRRQNNISPDLPPEHEWEQIRKEYFEKWGKRKFKAIPSFF